MSAKITFHPKDEIAIVAGKTFYVKERLKKAGARWNPTGSFWTLPITVATQCLLTELNEIVVAAIKAEKEADKKKREEAAALQAFYKTPAGKEQWWAEIQQAKSVYSFICCEQCEVIDWERQHTSCKACGHDGNTFFVRGILYTGD